MDLKCPNCGAPFVFQDLYASRCARCGYGVIHNDSTPELVKTIAKPPTIFGVERNGWICLAAGALIAIIVLAVPFFTQMLVVLPILVHEFGHAVMGWFFGYPSLPALDFTYGGGICVHWDRNILIMVVVYALWAGILYFWGLENRKRIAVVMTGLIAYTIFSFTSAHDVIILFMGHGMELVFAGIFIYRALSGSSVIHPVERPLYGYLGMFIVLNDLRFAYRLFTDETTRKWYENAKGGGHTMDFSRIAEDYLHIDLTSVAAFFMICCILTPFVAFAFLRWKSTAYRFFAE